MVVPGKEGVVMLMNQCPKCGGTLRPYEDYKMICTGCLYVYDRTAGQTNRSQNANKVDIESLRALTIATLILACFVSFAVGAPVLSIILVIVFIRIMIANEKRREFPPRTVHTVHSYAPKAQPVRTYGTTMNTKSPVTSAEYLEAFYQLNLPAMPLGKLGAEAVRQIQQLSRKQQALHDMLQPGHPFIVTGNEAEAYVLNNCKHILYRLKYCDQADQRYIREHDAYIRAKLRENEKILSDYEKLLIEITQMDDDAPILTPQMDVLADTLKSVRTYDGALENASQEPVQAFQMAQI